MSGHTEGGRSRNWFSRIAMVFLCVLWSIPTLGLLVSSFRPRIELERSGWWSALLSPFDSTWTLSNYSTVMGQSNMSDAFVNSIVVAIPATILPIMFAAFAAYAFTFMNFRGKDIVFILIVALMVVPIQAAYFAIEGTDDLLETYERIRARPNPNLKMLGVVITLFDKRTNISKDTHGQIRSVFGEVLFRTKISKNVRLEESPAYKETILTFAPKSPGAVEYKKLAAEVVQRVEESRVARHAEDAA